MKIIGIVESVTAQGRIQLCDEEGTYVVRYLQSDTGVVSAQKICGDLPAALKEFSRRILEERESLVVYQQIEEFTIVLNPTTDVSTPDYRTYMGGGSDTQDSLRICEEELEKDGKFSVEELRGNADYVSAVANLLAASDPETEHTGIALQIR